MEADEDIFERIRQEIDLDKVVADSWEKKRLSAEDELRSDASFCSQTILKLMLKSLVSGKKVAEVWNGVSQASSGLNLNDSQTRFVVQKAEEFCQLLSDPDRLTQVFKKFKINKSSMNFNPVERVVGNQTTHLISADQRGISDAIETVGRVREHVKAYKLGDYAAIERQWKDLFEYRDDITGINFINLCLVPKKREEYLEALAADPKTNSIYEAFLNKLSYPSWRLTMDLYQELVNEYCQPDFESKYGSQK